MLDIIDCHSHSINSPDAKDSVFDMCNKAIELSLKAYAITDHVECCAEKWEFEKADTPPVYFKDIFKNSMKDIEKAKDYYGNKLNLICGVELGEPLRDLNLAEKYLSENRLDFVIGSIHEVNGYRDFCWLNYNEIKPETVLEIYFNELLEMAKWGKFDVMGHLTYPLRYISRQGLDFDMSCFDSIIMQIFKEIIKNDCGIEVNASGLKDSCNTTFPSYKYVKMYYDLGGRIISVGSDSHCVEDVARGNDVAIKMIKEAGFNELTYFKNRKPNFISIK